MDSLRTGPRVRAPELIDGLWLNTPSPLTLAGLRGRFVLLDFWTFCCGNCLHVLDELRPFEAAYSDVLTVIGIHSPKFPHEALPSAVTAAVERYEVHHPVLNDPALSLWGQYAVRAWPTLVLIDPEGYVVAQAAGEGQVSALAAVLDRLVAEHSARGTLHRGTGPYTPPPPSSTSLRFPASAVVLPDSLLVADTGHHQLVELELDGVTERRRVGSGRGAPFTEPNGLCLLPDGSVLVADTGNHVLRRVVGSSVETIDLPALLASARTVTGAVPPVLSPWDVVWWPALDRVVVAAAGVHLLLALPLDLSSCSVLAGTTVEGLRDGPAIDGWLAQPSGLAVDGDRLWFVDSESSALRYLTVAGSLTTVVGEGLFDFGHVDGPAASARFQHPLGVLVLPDSSVAVLDTYNGAVRRYSESLSGGSVTTVASGLAEPSGAVLVDGELVVVESAAHQLVRVPLASDVVSGSAQRVVRPPLPLQAGPVHLDVAFQPAPGRKMDDRYGPSTLLTITASPASLLESGAGESTSLGRDLVLAAGTGVLHVTAQAASCDTDAEHPACYLARQDWGVPVEIGPDGDDTLRLVLLD